MTWTPEILSHNYPFVKGFTADPALVQLAMKACEGKVTAYAGRIATGDQFICEKSVRDDIVARTQPMAIEMEGGSIAHACAGQWHSVRYYPQHLRQCGR